MTVQKRNAELHLQSRPKCLKMRSRNFFVSALMVALSIFEKAREPGVLVAILLAAPPWVVFACTCDPTPELGDVQVDDVGADAEVSGVDCEVWARRTCELWQLCGPAPTWATVEDCVAERQVCRSQAAKDACEAVPLNCNTVPAAVCEDAWTL